MRKNIKKSKDELWRNVGSNFNKFLVPNRPSVENCSIYGSLVKKSIKNKNKPRVMLMGSTPEIRRVLYTAEFLNGAEVYCLDVNKSMFEAMSDLLIKSFNYKEKYFRHSWLETKFPDESFDLIIGDEVICNVDSDCHENLFKEIYRLLKENGSWVTRHDFYTDKVKKISIDKILLDVSKKVEEGKDDFQQGINTLYVKLLFYFGWKYHRENSLLSQFNKIKEVYLKKLTNDKLGKIIKELINIFKNNFVKIGGDYKWYVLSEEDSDKELKRYFHIKGKYYAKDYPTCEFSPIYYLIKK
jgi:ubiquinone/menaquinone biosynthesis C-methylase UbiE